MIVAIDTRKATICKADLLTSGSAGIEVTFRFSADWDGLSKIAVFKGSGVNVDVVLTDTTCVIPAETLVQSGLPLHIGVYGTDGTGEVIIPTIWANAGTIRAGTKPGETTPIEPTPSVVDQILAAATEAVEIAQSVRDDADSGAFDGATGPQGPQGPQGEQGPPGPPEVYWVTYGVTTNAEIEAAYQAGKLILCKYRNKIYTSFWWTGETRHYLYCMTGDVSYCIMCINGVWREMTTYLAEAGSWIPTPWKEPLIGDFLVFDGETWEPQTTGLTLDSNGILSIGVI